jgi:rubrerythrin
MDIDIPSERVKGKEYRCKDCGEGFRGVGKNPICPSCQSDNVAEA